MEHSKAALCLDEFQFHNLRVNTEAFSEVLWQPRANTEAFIACEMLPQDGSTEI